MNEEKIAKLVEQACWRQIGVWSSKVGRCEYLEIVRHCRNCEVFSSAAQGVFARESSQAKLFERSLDLFHSGEVVARSEGISLLPFRLGTTWFCTRPKEVISIAPQSKVHRIPNRESGFIRGLVPVDGAIYPSICLNVFFGLTCAGEERYQDTGVFERTVILQAGKKRLAVSVDEVRNLHYFKAQEAKPPGHRCSDKLRPYVKQEFVFDSYLDEVVFELDMESIGLQYLKALT
ncbi:MAG: chemotaxis protein CheW [Gammaproteobacteria bacterium]|nr:chemotaxis protein CheW [Gammaproteobacteria bacterium]